MKSLKPHRACLIGLYNYVAITLRVMSRMLQDTSILLELLPV